MTPSEPAGHPVSEPAGHPVSAPAGHAAFSHGCAQCGSPLADDQRYCVVCGERRGPVPGIAARTIASLAAGKRSAEPPSDGGRPRDPLAEAARMLSAVSPRAAAVVVMALLAFGVVVGSGASSLANSGPSLLIAVRQPAPAPAPTSGRGRATHAAPSARPAPQQTVTAPTPALTVTAPSSPTPITPTTTRPTPVGPILPPVKHVFVVMLSGQGYSQAWGKGSDLPYLAHKLRRQGELIPNYYAVAQSSLANGIALISGQGPTPQTEFDCPLYSSMTPATRSSEGELLGSGCVYPATAKTLPAELTARGYTWKAYVQGINDGPKGTAKTCRRPAIGASDPALTPVTQDPYVTWRNPFVYFQALTKGRGCAKRDVSLTQLASDLKERKTTPSLSYIVPDPCDDGSGQPCTGGAQPGAQPDVRAAGPATDSFLHRVVTAIERSPAYKASGLIAITFDQAPQAGQYSDQSACCNNPAYPNLNPGGTSSTSTSTTSTTTSTTSTTTTTSTTPVGNGNTTPTGGGGQVGLLLISRWVKRNSADTVNYFNHYSLQASIAALFNVHRLGYAIDPSLPVFNATDYNAYSRG